MKMETKRKSLNTLIREKAAAVSGKSTEAIFSEMMDTYLEGHADGYNKALGKPAVQEGGTADRKEFVKREGKRDE